jgi:hypothetical protein
MYFLHRLDKKASVTDAEELKTINRQINAQKHTFSKKDLQKM